jgi:hypothetical protein
MRTTTTPFRSMLPLAGLLVLAATNACVIVNDDGDDDDECVDLTEVCPNLSCEFGNVVVDGCAICECNTACDPGPAPECAFPVLIEDECRWQCGAGQCFTDADCGPGFICVQSFEAPGGDQADPSEAVAFPPADGVCIPVQTGCVSDADCGEGFFCDFDGAEGRAAPPPPGDGSDEQQRPQPDPLPEGQCRPLPTTCFEDTDCPEGQICQQRGFANGLVAPGGVCIDPPPVSECEVDTDCDEGQVCAVECRSDPNCPACPVCFVVGTCVAAEQPCFSDDECAEGFFCDFSGAAARPCFDADNDGRCDDASDLLPPAGICRPLEEPNPCAFVLCREGTTCVVDNGQATCVADGSLCRSDDECDGGLVCNAADICLPPPDCDPARDLCLAVCYGVCVEPVRTCFADTDCDRGEICVFDDDGGFNRRIIAPRGTCQPAPTPCRADDACAAGEICLDGACVEDPNANPCAIVRCRPGTTCRVNAAGNAECVPDAVVCMSDADCRDGGRCNAGIDVCNPPPDCQPDAPCPDVCFGFCE